MEKLTVPPPNYSSAWEERDYLLEYKSIDIKRLTKEVIHGVPVNNVTRDEAIALVMDLVDKKQGPQHVVFLDPIKLMQIRPKKKLGFVSQEARILLADGAGIRWAAKKLGHPLKERIPMIAFIMDIVRLAMKKDLTIYMLGSRQEYLEKVFFNMQKSFPGVRIIGRQSGFFDAQREKLVKESLRKSSPNIILIGMGFPYQELWIRENREYLSNAVVVGVDGAFDILSGEEKKAPDWAQLRGMAWLWRLVMRPFLINRWFYLGYFWFKTQWTSFRRPKES